MSNPSILQYSQFAHDSIHSQASAKYQHYHFQRKRGMTIIISERKLC